MTNQSESTVEQQVGATLRGFRQARGLSQQQVADAMVGLGFSWRQTTVAKTEAAERPVPVGEVVALAGLLGVGIHDLLTIKQVPTSEETALLFDVLAAQRQLERAHQQVSTAESALAEAQARYDQARGVVSDDG